MKFSLYGKKNVLDEMQEQTISKIERCGFWLMWGGLLAAMVIQKLTGNADKATGEWVVFMAGCVYTVAGVPSGMACGTAIFLPISEPMRFILCWRLWRLRCFCLTYGYWMGAAFTGVSTGLLCFALLQFCAHLVQKNRKKLDDEPEEK